MAKTRMPIPWDWDGESWKCWAIEWPDSPLWRAILEGFITTPMRGWFWDERTGNVTEVQLIGIEIDNRNHPHEEVLMACNEETTTILQGILDQLTALVNKPCCPATGTGTGSRGAGGSAAAPNPYDDGGEPGDFPPGFEDRDEWKSHQCDMAEDILNALKADLLGLSGLSYAAATPTGMVGLLIGILLTPIPFDDLIALLGFLIYTGYNYSLLATMATQIEASQDELRCILYSAGSVETAQSDLMAELTEIADAAFTLEADKVWVMETIGFMVPTDSLNRLFADVPTISQGADCSGCAESGISPWTVVYGNATNTSPDNPIGGEGVYEPGYGCLLNARHFGVSFAQPASVNLFTVDGVVPPICSGGPTFFYYSDDNFTDLISSTNSAPQFDPAVGIRSMYVVWDGSGIGDNVILQQEPYF